MARNRRTPRSYARRAATREPYASILIVCEGGKTEPNYFKGLRIAYRLSNANIHVTPADGTDPMSVVQFAEREFTSGDYDRVYCVFDRDTHATYDAARRRVDALPNFYAAVSWLCFEVWVLLHYRYSTAPIESVGKRSACDNAVRELRNHLPNYAKGLVGIFDILAAQLDVAIEHGGRLCEHNEQNGSVNPATNVQDLVEFLIHLKS